MEIGPGYWVVGVTSVPCLHLESPWTPSMNLSSLEFCAHGALQTSYANGVAAMASSSVSSAHVHAPLSQWTSPIKHKFRDKIITHTNMTWLNQTEGPSEPGPHVIAQAECPWSSPVLTTSPIPRRDCWNPEREKPVPKVTQPLAELEFKSWLCLIRPPMWPVWHSWITNETEVRDLRSLDLFLSNCVTVDKFASGPPLHLTYACNSCLFFHPWSPVPYAIVPIAPGLLAPRTGDTPWDVCWVTMPPFWWQQMC